MDGIGPALRRLRKQAHLSQPELARRSGISQQEISNVELGRRVPSMYVVLALTQALGTTAAALLDEAGISEAEGVSVYDVIRELEPDERQRVNEYARWRLAEQKARYTTGGKRE